MFFQEVEPRRFVELSRVRVRLALERRSDRMHRQQAAPIVGEVGGDALDEGAADTLSRASGATAIKCISAASGKWSPNQSGSAVRIDRTVDGSCLYIRSVGTPTSSHRGLVACRSTSEEHPDSVRFVVSWLLDDVRASRRRKSRGRCACPDSADRDQPGPSLTLGSRRTDAASVAISRSDSGWFGSSPRTME